MLQALEKMSQLKVTSIKRKERIKKNIDQELENWKNLKTNSEKMVLELNDRKEKIEAEIIDNQKNPEKIATIKGQNLQNIENTKKRNEELEIELNDAEKKFNLINQNVREVQEKLSNIRESKARNEATIEGIESRKTDLFYSIKSELNINNDSALLGSSDLNQLSEDQYPDLDQQSQKVEEAKKQRENLGSVNLRADVETKKISRRDKKKWKMIGPIFTQQL